MKRYTKRNGYSEDLDLTQELGYSHIYNQLSKYENDIEDGFLEQKATCDFNEWIDPIIGSVWQCSNCEQDFCFMEGDAENNGYKYCPECGARIININKVPEELGEEE